MAIEVSRRGFLKLLGMGAAVAASGQTVALVTEPEFAGKRGYFPFPVRETLDYNIECDEYIYRVDCMYTTGDGHKRQFCVSALFDPDISRARFDKVCRHPAAKALRADVRAHGGTNIYALPMPPGFQPLPIYLRAA